jgi:phage FluMu gp28-like protein
MILDKIRFAYDEIPDWLLTLANAHSQEHAQLRIVLDNGSKAIAASGASKSARGKTATFLVLDECAFIEDAEELWGSAQQTLSTGGSAILLSTPNGVSNLFNLLYTEAELGENEFIPVKLKWDVHPDRDGEIGRIRN